MNNFCAAVRTSPVINGILPLMYRDNSSTIPVDHIVLSRHRLRSPQSKIIKPVAVKYILIEDSLSDSFPPMKTLKVGRAAKCAVQENAEKPISRIQ
jgi:hypothetical protein